MIREYRNLLAKNESDGGAWYLLGRLLENDQEAMDHYRKAVEAQPPCAYAYFAMAYRDLCRGDYQDSLELGSKALALDKENGNFRDVVWQSALGLQKWDELLGQLAPLRSESPGSVELAAQEIRVDLRQGDEAKAKRVQAGYMRDNRDLSDDDRKMVGLYFDSLFSYAAGDTKAYAQTVRQLDSHQWTVEAAICEEKAEEALQACKDWGEDCPYSYLLMTYVLAAAAHDEKAAPEALQLALGVLKKGGENGVTAARLLESPGSDDLSVLQLLSILPEDKSVIAAALGHSNPAIQKECFEMARTLNIGMAFPSLPLKNLLAKQGP